MKNSHVPDGRFEDGTIVNKIIICLKITQVLKWTLCKYETT